MPQNYSRSRARFSGEYSGSGGYSGHGGGGNSLMKAILAIVGVAAVVLVAVVFWKPLTELVGLGGQETPTPTAALEATPSPEFSAPPEPTPDPTPELTATPDPTPEPTPTPEPYVDFTVSAVGDIIIESSVLTDAKADGSEYDFAPFFAKVKDSLSKADLTLGTLETTLIGKNYSGATKYSTPDSILAALKDAGFDAFSTAHTRIFDNGFDGALKTMEAIRGAGLFCTGTYTSTDDYHATPIYPLADKGINVAILAYSADEKYDIPGDKMRFAVKRINLSTIKKDVEAARTGGANVVIVMMHWGSESGKEATAAMKDQAKKIIGYGADLILGSHPLYLHKIERISTSRDDGTTAEGIVAYSLGSFLSGQQQAGKDTGLILNVTFRKDMATNIISIQQATYVPTWVYLTNKEYTVLPAGKYKDDEALLDTLSTKGRDRIKKAWQEATDLIGSASATAANE